jgi:membrane-bound lytic murein transglycosylase D
VKPDPPLNFETFELPGQTDLKVVADLIGVPYEVVQDLNPELRRGTSPAGQRYGIKLPKGMKKQFEIAYAELPEEKRVRKVVVPADEIAGGYRPAYRVQLASYRVGRGETLASLARRNRVSVQELARLNRLSTRGELRKGQTIRIPKQVRASRDRRGRYGKIGRYRTEPVVRSRRSGQERARRGPSHGRSPGSSRRLRR